MLYFRSEDDEDETEYFSYDELLQWRDHAGKPWFQGVVYIYYEPSLMKVFNPFSINRSTGSFKDLNSYMKKLNDPRLR